MIICPARILLNTFHIFRSAGEQFLAVPRYFCFRTFYPKVKARSVSTGPQTTGFGEVPQQAFWQAFLPPDGAKILSVFTHSNCLPKTQVRLHLSCLPLVKRPQKAFLPQCENKYHSTPLTDHSCSYILYLKPAPREGQ